MKNLIVCVSLLLATFAGAGESDPAPGLPKGVLMVADYNGDGISDYLLFDSDASGSKNSAYSVHLSKKGLRGRTVWYKLKHCVVNPEWDAKRRVLISQGSGGAGCRMVEYYRLSGVQAQLIESERREAKSTDAGVDIVVTRKKLVKGCWRVKVSHE